MEFHSNKVPKKMDLTRIESDIQNDHVTNQDHVTSTSNHVTNQYQITRRALMIEIKFGIIFLLSILSIYTFVIYHVIKAILELLGPNQTHSLFTAIR